MDDDEEEEEDEDEAGPVDIKKDPEEPEPSTSVRNNHAQAKRMRARSLRRHSVASTEKKRQNCQTNRQNCQKIATLVILWRFFPVLATLCRRSERARIRFAWAWL